MKYRIFTILIMMFALVGCGDEKDIASWIEKTNGLLVEATKQATVLPYQNQQHEALKAYFSELEIKLLAVKESKKATEALNSVLSKMDFNEVCSKILMPKTAWNKVMKGCSKNRYFLCSEDVKAYPDAIKSLIDLLNTEMQKKFDETPVCKAAI